jgi:hypothetical protein
LLVKSSSGNGSCSSATAIRRPCRSVPGKERDREYRFVEWEARIASTSLGFDFTESYRAACRCVFSGEAEFLTDYRSPSMVPKIPKSKKVTRGCPTLVSRSLEGAIQVPVSSTEEPWRNRRKSNNRGQRRK